MFFTSWSYFKEFLLSFNLPFTVLKIQIIFWDMTVKVGPHNRYLIQKENGKKSLFRLKSISFIFQTILLTFLAHVPYIIRKKHYVGILIISNRKKV